MSMMATNMNTRNHHHVNAYSHGKTNANANALVSSSSVAGTLPAFGAVSLRKTSNSKGAMSILMMHRDANVDANAPEQISVFVSPPPPPLSVSSSNIELDNHRIKGAMATIMTCALSTSAAVLTMIPSIAAAAATADDDIIEIAELPPVWVPIVFAIVIIGGVGLLTFSLGDVYTEGESFLCSLCFVSCFFVYSTRCTVVYKYKLNGSKFIYIHTHTHTEASLGLMSGAKAKKEKERSRSSYFKNNK